jgi:site-specific recombinase XerD
MSKRDLSPEEARDYYLDEQRADATDWTVRTYRYRLKQFVEWCEENNVTQMGDVDGWTIEQFARERRSELATVSMKGQMSALKQLLEYCARIDVVDKRLPGKVEIPSVSRNEESDDTRLETDAAESLLQFYRNSQAHFGRKTHALLEVFWNTGARLSGVRALDLGDYDSDERYLEFQHRPDSGTGLKNKERGERPVVVPPTVCDVLDTYVARERFDKRDDAGRKPLFAGRQGRPSDSTLRAWTYRATQPCVERRCPHGERQESCDYRHRDHLSKCPSARAPHHIRTGSITWQLNSGLPIEVVAERVNATPAVIERHYDKAKAKERMQERRREYTNDLDVKLEGDS